MHNLQEAMSRILPYGGLRFALLPIPYASIWICGIHLLLPTFD